MTYRIVIHTFDQEVDNLLISTLRGYFQNVSCVNSVTKITEVLKEKLPTVVLVSEQSFQQSLVVYYQALNEISPEDCNDHAFVSLINRHDEPAAYEAYNAGVLDDYLICRPLYEMHRPILICDHLLKEMGISAKQPDSLEYLYRNENLSQDVRKVMAKGVEMKESLNDSFELTIKNISKTLDDAQIELISKKQTSIDLEELKNTLANIKSNHIRPELIKLQEKALSLLTSFVVDKKVEAKPEAPLIPQINNAVQAAAHASSQASEQQLKPAAEPLEVNKVKTIPKILLVEDDPISIHCTTLLLSNYKMDIDTALTGRRALAALKSKKYDIVFLDLNLPDTNGIYILDQIKRSDCLNKPTPIILLTGNKNKNTVKQAIQMGAEGYIVKPLYKDILYKHFKKYNIPLYVSKK